MAKAATDDQVSLVLSHLQAPPAFRAATSAKNSPTNSNKKRKQSKYFSSVVFKGDTLRLVYLDEPTSLRLEFQVSTASSPYQIRYVGDQYKITKSLHEAELEQL